MVIAFYGRPLPQPIRKILVEMPQQMNAAAEILGKESVCSAAVNSTPSYGKQSLPKHPRHSNCRESALSELFANDESLPVDCVSKSFLEEMQLERFETYLRVSYFEVSIAEVREVLSAFAQFQRNVFIVHLSTLSFLLPLEFNG
jgi:hypothetical protein